MVGVKWKRECGCGSATAVLVSPCHAGHAAGCHHGTYSSGAVSAAGSSCAEAKRSGPVSSAAPLASEVGWQIFLWGISRMRSGRTWSEARDGKRGQTLHRREGSGTPRTRGGGGSSRSFTIFIIIQKCLCNYNERNSQVRRIFVRLPDFVALIW